MIDHIDMDQLQTIFRSRPLEFILQSAVSTFDLCGALPLSSPVPLLVGQDYVHRSIARKGILFPSLYDFIFVCFYFTLTLSPFGNHNRFFIILVKLALIVMMFLQTKDVNCNFLVVFLPHFVRSTGSIPFFIHIGCFSS